MKRIFTLTALLVIVALFTFGQNSGIAKSSVEKKFYELKQNATQQSHFRLFQNTLNLKEAPGFNSVLAGSQRLDSFVALDWNKTTNQWTNSTKSEFIYDNSTANVRNTQYTEFDWDAVTSQWKVTGIVYYSYEANGDMLQTMDTEWEGGSDLWVADVKNVYSFNADGTMKVLLSYVISETTNQWQAFMKTEYSYNAGGQRTKDLVSVLFDETATDWFAYSKVEYTYNDKSNLKEELAYSLDFTTQQMELSGKTEYIFDGSANLAQMIEYEKDQITKIMTAKWKSDFTLDNSGNIITEIFSNWDDNTQKWNVEYKDENVFNNNYSFNDLILPVIFKELKIYLNHMLTGLTESVWDLLTSAWTLESKYVFNYSAKYPTSVEKLNSEAVRIYPNPVLDYIMIDWPGDISPTTIEVSDLNGRKMLNENVTSNSRINLSGLTSGVYFYTIIANGIRHHGKLIKN